MSQRIERNDVDTFLAGRRIAVVGASDQPNDFGRTIVTALHAHGYDVVAVNPNGDETVAGAPCYPKVAAVPGGIDGAAVMVHRDRAGAVVDELLAYGVGSIWLFKGIGGAGAVSDDAVTRAPARRARTSSRGRARSCSSSRSAARTSCTVPSGASATRSHDAGRRGTRRERAPAAR